jgi:hypothetical protein
VEKTDYGLAGFIDGYGPRLAFNMVEEDKSLKEGVVDYLEGEVTETSTARDTFNSEVYGSLVRLKLPFLKFT